MDPRVTRRSPRLAEQRPAYPQTQSQQIPFPSGNPASAFQSSSSLSSMSTPNTNMSTSPNMEQNPQFNSAPLPSPSQTDQTHYFGSLQARPEQHQQQQQHSLMQAQQQYQQRAYTGQKEGSGGLPETAPYLSNLNLVAEAAKRAQMACLMRDFGDCEL